MDHEGIAVALADRVVILVHAEPAEVERFPVDVELVPHDVHGANTHPNGVGVDNVIGVAHLDKEVVEPSLTGFPQDWVLDLDVERIFQALRINTHRIGSPGLGTVGSEKCGAECEQ